MIVTTPDRIVLTPPPGSVGRVDTTQTVDIFAPDLQLVWAKALAETITFPDRRASLDDPQWREAQRWDIIASQSYNAGSAHAGQVADQMTVIVQSTGALTTDVDGYVAWARRMQFLTVPEIVAYPG